ncbi:hypothetical protein LENED_002081 [Lentinula edodes]|uniref:Uncharacterized protein n=1 Tax=Lentinula edodes TaxID=5353 RepID=A0A1Q3DZW8_LENED|nr:hypothetical protein LENED_002081 [Lentinula edodes]
MAIEAYDLIQEDALTQLTRAELQALGKAHNVKANLKSATIISQLLKKFPDGVPNPNTDPALAPRKRGRIKRGDAKKKKAQVKKEESVNASVMFSNGDSELEHNEGRTSASLLGNPPVTNDEVTTETVSRPTKSRPTRATSRKQTTFEEPLRPTLSVHSPTSSPAHPEIVALPVPTEIATTPLPNEPATGEPPQIPTPQIELEAAGGEESEIVPVEPTGDENEVELDNLSEVSEITHNPSESSRGASPQPLANDATLKYVVDIIKANTEKDKQMRDEIKILQERAANAKKLLQEQNYLLTAEREHRDRIISFFLYHIRNNNRWIGQSLNPGELEANVLKEFVSNGGRGWRDMGEWEYGEVWSGPMVVSDSNIEITASNLDEYLRDMWDIHQRERKEGKMKANHSSINSAPPPSPPAGTPDAPVNDTAHSSDAPVSLSRKRKITTIPLDDENRPAEKRQRLSPIPEGLTADPLSSPLPIPRRNKGKGRMSALEVEQLQREQVREERVWSMRELDEDDSAEAYEIQIALADSLLQSAGELAMDH